MLIVPPHAEDQQPNEAINKRRNVLPPMIKPAAPPRSRGRGGFGRGRGSWGKSRRGGFTHNSLGRKKHGIIAGPNRPPSGSGLQPTPIPAGRCVASSSETMSPNFFDMKHSISRIACNESQSPLNLSSVYHRYPLPRQEAPSHALVSPVTAPPALGTQQPNPSTQAEIESRQDLMRLQVPPRSYTKRRRLQSCTSDPRATLSPPALFGSVSLQVTNATSPVLGPDINESEQEFVQLPVVKVKSERSPSPPLCSSTLDEPIKVKEGCTRYAPVPSDCRKSDPNCLANRKAWVRRETAVLKQLGIQKDRCFFRDDGMVIEWHSEVPLNASELVHRIQERHIENMHMGIDPTEPRQRGLKCAISPGLDRGEGSSAAKPIIVDMGGSGTCETEVDAYQQQPDDSSSALPPTKTSIAISQPDSSKCSANHVEENQYFRTVQLLNSTTTQLTALQFAGLYIHRYMSTFDLDRMSLVDAYDPSAVFSCRASTSGTSTDLFSFVGPLQRQPVPQGQVDRCIHQGHLSVLTAISQLGPYVFGHQLPTIDATQLLHPTLSSAQHNSRMIFFVCETVMNSAQGNGTLACIVRHSLLIKEGESVKQWPYVAVNHQMSIYPVRLTDA